MTQSFADFIKLKKEAEAAAPAAAVTVTPTASVQRTRPAEYQSRIVILRRRADGTIEEKPAAPAFLRQDPKVLVERIILPADYYWRGSPEHQARKAELEKEKGA
ncbi:hypothetical protein [Rhizobium sp. Leaf383]|uniref:hypothetical protein n=1 Tax=Rhizobium sp. Leaf383 TaxID=1736357 RepID=UPI0007125285|nr:hypothetical protein [Rhizobium sp. Leaf383]KQS84810.1 hypothetical protein ASG58_20135 [Rhizobium sp. Leaf383]